MNRIAYLENLLVEMPEDPFVPYALALEFVKINDSYKATFYFEKVLKIDASYLGLYYQYAKFKLEQRQKKEALDIVNAGIIVAITQANNHTLSELQFLKEDIDDAYF